MEINYETIRNIETRVERIEAFLEQMMQEKEEEKPIRRRTK